MIRHPSIWGVVAASGLSWLAIAPASTARAASPVSPAVIASAAAGQGDDFWEDRYNAMRKIWGTPYVPLGYYWDQARGLPPRPAPVAPGVYADRPIAPYGGLGYGPGFGRGDHGRHRSYRPAYNQGFGNPYGYGPGYGYGPTPGYGYGPTYGYGPGYGYGPMPGVLSYPGYGSPYGGFYGW